jgi:hypothetical protein
MSGCPSDSHHVTKRLDQQAAYSVDMLTGRIRTNTNGRRSAWIGGFIFKKGQSSIAFVFATNLSGRGIPASHGA